MKTRNAKSGRRQQRGFSLLEAMIGFVILSTGMLGIASLQAISLKAGKTSVYGSVAMMKVDELVESMRANPTSLATYTGAGANNNCNTAKNCTVAELAADDVYWWNEHLEAGLPGSTVTTSVLHTAPVPPSHMATVTVTVNWKERNSDSAGDESVDRSYTTTANICTEIPC